MKESKPTKIVTQEKGLRTPCKPCSSVEEGEAIGKKLLDALKQNTLGVGLAANQIGINSRVCAITVRRPIVLINPKIISKFGRVYFNEGCLSFPGESVLTERYANIAVNADNHPTTLFFKAEDNILECICVQHEIDHLDGITMHDRRPEDYYELNLNKK